MARIKHLFIVTLFGLTSFLLQAQDSDILFTFKENIPCRVKEVTPSMVKYSYPHEEVIYSMPLGNVQKIVFSSGRVQQFSSEPLVKQVRYVEDWKNVLVIKNQTEVYGFGLKPFAEMTIYSKYGSVQSARTMAATQLMQLAAMKGHPVVLKTFEEEELNDHSGIRKDIIGGIPYGDSLLLPTMEKLTSLIGSKTKLDVTRKYVLSPTGLADALVKTHFYYTNMVTKNGIVYLVGNIGLHEGAFRLVYLGPSYFVLYFKGDYDHYNFVVNY
jgi:hypothetical protein